MVIGVINIEMHEKLTIWVGCKQIYDYLHLPVKMSILRIGVTLHYYGCHGNHAINTIISRLIYMIRDVIKADLVDIESYKLDT